MFVEVAGPTAWLSLWHDARLVQWRQIAAVADLGAEIARSLHQSEPTEDGSTPIVALTPTADLVSVLTQEGIRAELIDGPSPAFLGLDALEADAKFWLPEVLHAEEERRLRRQRLLQRTVAVAVLVGTIGVAGWAEWLQWTSQQRVADAQHALERVAGARERALRERADRMRRDLNRSGFRAWATALAALTPTDRPTLRASLEQGVWRLELETTSFDAAQQFAATVGCRSTLRPRRVYDGFGWAVTADIPEAAWIGWPSPASPSGS